VKDADAADDDANADDDAFPLARRPGVILARHTARIVVFVVVVVSGRTDGRTDGLWAPSEERVRER
jgi:hypothetical protein